MLIKRSDHRAGAPVDLAEPTALLRIFDDHEQPVLIVAGLALVGVSTWSRAEGREKTTQAGELIIVVGAFLSGLSIFVSHGK